jgi:SCY1-like protein 1
LVREQTVKAVLTVVPKLSDRIVNGELLRYLAKTANDEQPGIRTNTTICLGKIARNLGANNRAKVLTAAFARSLRDPFLHARNAALLALAATSDLFSEEDCATKLLPVMCPSLVDKEKIIRDQANKTVDIYLARIKKHAQTMPDSVLPPPSVTAAGGGAPRMGTPANDTSWAGWAISSFTKNLATASGEIQAGSNGTTTPQQRPSSVPPPASEKAQRPMPTSTKSGMALNKTSASIPSILSPDPADAFADAEEDFGDGWGGFEDGVTNIEADVEPDPWASPAPTPSASSKGYDDQGEPDFAGWLAAQSKTKTVIKNPLPKGLAKAGATKSVPAKAAPMKTLPMKSTRPAIKSRANTEWPSGTEKQAAQPKKEVPKVEAKKEDEDEGWGDAW